MSRHQQATHSNVRARGKSSSWSTEEAWHGRQAGYRGGGGWWCCGVDGSPAGEADDDAYSLTWVGYRIKLTLTNSSDYIHLGRPNNKIKKGYSLIHYKAFRRLLCLLGPHTYPFHGRFQLQILHLLCFCFLTHRHNTVPNSGPLRSFGLVAHPIVTIPVLSCTFITHLG